MPDATTHSNATCCQLGKYPSIKPSNGSVATPTSQQLQWRDQELSTLNSFQMVRTRPGMMPLLGLQLSHDATVGAAAES